MLACDSKRQHNHFFSSQPFQYHNTSPSYPHQQQQHFFAHTLPPTPTSSLPLDFDSRATTAAYVDSINRPVDYSAYASPSSSNYHLMNQFNYSNPAIRVQNPTPTPAYSSANGYQQQQQQQQQPASIDTTQFANLWNNANSNSHMVATGSPALQSTSLNPGIKRSHQRTASNSSSVASTGGASSYGGSHATSFPYSSPAMSTASRLNQSYNVDASRKYSHNLPTPTQTPTQDSFLASQYQNFGSQHADATTVASLAMNKAMEQHSVAEDDVPGMSRSGRHSVSSMGPEPTTPHTVAEGYDGDFKIPTHGEIASSTSSEVEVWLEEYLQFDSDSDTHVVPRFERTLTDMKHTVPKFDRTMSDIYADELYDPSTVAPAVKPVQPGHGYLSPFVRNSRVTEALQAAQMARSQSPNSKTSRGVSPFRPDSPYVQDTSRLQTAAQIRANQKAQADLNELSQHISPRAQQEMKTISPKDAMLEYRADEDDHNANVPLFPQSSFGQQDFTSPAQSQYSQDLNTFTGNNRTSSWTDTRSQYQSSPLAPAPQQQQQPQQPFNFNPPSSAASQFQTMPFDYRQAAAPVIKQDPTPDFPAHLTSMESSASEAPASSQGSQQYQVTSAPSITSSTSTSRPEGGATLADTGAFTCTYHGCNMRFPTQQKLQKHKREGHRTSAILPNQTQEITPGVGSGMSSAALLARNSQAGPHKCDRINPTTGKPCNTVFSRPYDLTRHEDTIHNCRKQKVRCALCVEEKMFSRNDALTRHMRVVHPEVDFPGKHRRRGGVE